MKTINISNLQSTHIGLEYMHAEKIRPNLEVNDYHYPDTPYGHFVYGIKGYANYIYKGHLIELYPNTLAYIPTGSNPFFNEDLDFEYIKIYFTIKELSTGDEVILFDIPQIIFNETPPHISYEINNLCAYYAANTAAYLKQCSMLYSLINNIHLSLTKADNPQSYSSLSITPALLFMRSNYQYAYTIKELADMCCLSEPYFRKKFKEYTHSTPTEYKQFLQINHACRLLQDQSFSIGFIAGVVGFNTMQYFYKVFSKIIGISPSEYRKRLAHYMKIK